MKPRPPTLQADSLPAEPPGKPKNTGVGSLSLLQQVFPTQESNQVSYIADGFFTSWATFIDWSQIPNVMVFGGGALGSVKLHPREWN